jgi:hypothetical protein
MCVADVSATQILHLPICDTARNVVPREDIRRNEFFTPAHGVGIPLRLREVCKDVIDMEQYRAQHGPTCRHKHAGTSAAGHLACNRRSFPAADQNEGDDNEIPAMSRQLAGESDFLIFVQAHTGFRFLAAQ